MCVFTPVIIDQAWPVLSSILATVMVSAGYAAATQTIAEVVETAQASRTVALEIPQALGFEENLGDAEELSFSKGSLTLTLRKPARGGLALRASSTELSEHDLAHAAEDALHRFLQEYVRQRVAAELEKRGFSIKEERLPDGGIKTVAKSYKLSLETIIAPDGSLKLDTKTVKGQACRDAADLFKKIVGPELSRTKTSKYFEPEGHIHPDVHGHG